MPLDPFLVSLMPMPAMPEIIDDWPDYRAAETAGYAGFVEQLAESAPEGVAIDVVELPVAGGTIDLKVYRTTGQTGPLPAYLYIRGGGWGAPATSPTLSSTSCAPNAPQAPPA